MRSLQGPAETLYQVFEEQGAELYWLAFLLTGDRELGIDSFTSALDLGEDANPAFRGFMISWARKLIVAQALSRIGPELRESARRARTEPWPHGALPSDAAVLDGEIDRAELERALLALDVFPRCAVLLTVFERMAVAEAASLLNADVELVKRAQVRGLAELTRNIAMGRGWNPSKAARERRSCFFERSRNHDTEHGTDRYQRAFESFGGLVVRGHA